MNFSKLSEMLNEMKFFIRFNDSDDKLEYELQEIKLAWLRSQITKSDNKEDKKLTIDILNNTIQQTIHDFFEQEKKNIPFCVSLEENPNIKPQRPRRF